MDFQTFKKTPKGERHVHLEGSFRPERALALAAGSDHPWNGLSVRELKGRLKVGTFEQFIQEFMSGYRLLKTADQFQMVTEDLCRSFEEMGVTCAEVLYSPGVYIQMLGRDLKEIHTGIGRALDYFPGIKLRFVLDTVLNLGLDFMSRTLEAVLADRPAFVQGFSVGGGVPNLDMKTFLPLFHRASAAGLFLVAHAGEVDSYQNIQVLVAETDICRIAHGCAAAASPDLCNMLAQRDIGIDVSLTSNLFTGAVSDLKAHPIRVFHQHGIRLTLNTDDPFYFDTDLWLEYRKAADILGFSDQDLLQFMTNSLNGR